ncbi:Aldo/keto reductase [Penicillium chrysogenum]|uniref:Aldo/keto reductase n=1 Tax=Penicillium chrysogenum TaxID=5076 RepID=A0ABQ8WS12_PENCH|nr:Aldo/keto reductase [Penicillium chrysogenum]
MAALSKLPLRQLGRNGPLVPRLGLGSTGASGIYNAPLSEVDHLAFLDEAYNRGETFWDTADKYGASEDVLGKWFAANPDKRENIFLSIKFGIILTPGQSPPFKVAPPEYCREAIEASLHPLNLPYVNVYYVHRLDKVTPIEKTMEAMEKSNSLSECSAESLRRAYAVHPITAVQVEFSLFCGTIESSQTRLLETARKLGVTIVCYSPPGNGFLTNTIRSRGDVKPGDSRVHLPWLKEEDLDKDVPVVEKIAGIAALKGFSSAQLALAWLLAQGDDIFPIPGTSRANRLVENLESVRVSVSTDEDKALWEIADAVVGTQFQGTTGYAFSDTPATHPSTVRRMF